MLTRLRILFARRDGVGVAACIVGSNVSRRCCLVPLLPHFRGSIMAQACAVPGGWQRSVGLNTCLSKCKTISPKTRAHVGRYSTIFLWHRDRLQQFRVHPLAAQLSERRYGRCAPPRLPSVHPRQHLHCHRQRRLLSGWVARANCCRS